MGFLLGAVWDIFFKKKAAKESRTPVDMGYHSWALCYILSALQIKRNYNNDFADEKTRA